MAGADHVLFNNLEQALSTDFNKVQDMAARNVADLLRFMLHHRAAPVGPTNVPVSTERDVVLGGLVVTPDGGAGVNVAAGALLQYSPTALPVPDTLDSQYRIGINRAIENVAAPSPGGDTYYLLEAQMEEVVTVNEVRNIFTPPSGPFVPTPVDKQVERQIAFQFTAGTATQAPAASTDWVPIAVVFRPGGGGDVAQEDIIDVRPQWQRRMIETPVETQMPAAIVTSWASKATSVPGTYTTEAKLDVEAYLNGEHLFFRTFTTAAVDLASAAYIEPGISSPFPGTAAIFYLYLCPPRAGMVPSGQYADSVAHRGVLVLSRGVPSTQHINLAGIALPAPWAGITIPAGQAVCVGAFAARVAGFEAQWCDRNGWHHLTTDGGINTHGTLNAGTPNQDVDLNTFLGGFESVPYNARTLHAEVSVSVVDATQGNASWSAIASGGVPANLYRQVPMDRSVYNGQNVHIPVDLVRQFRFEVAGGVGTAAVVGRTVGWSY